MNSSLTKIKSVTEPMSNSQRMEKIKSVTEPISNSQRMEKNICVNMLESYIEGLLKDIWDLEVKKK